MADKNVLIIGGGVAGLAAAVELADLDIQVELIEKSNFLGGHAIGYACKAINNTCVKCGACMVEEKLQSAVSHPNIKVLTGSQVQSISKNHRFTASIRQEPLVIDREKCTNCGLCGAVCPLETAPVGELSLPANRLVTTDWRDLTAHRLIQNSARALADCAPCGDKHIQNSELCDHGTANTTEN